MSTAVLAPKRPLLVAALVACVAAFDARPAGACATAPPAGAEVAIASEEALIVWDPATKTETFVRRSEFRSTAKTFGFLVPTPTVPAIAETPDTVFAMLASLTEPEVRYDSEWKLVPFGIACVTMGKEERSSAAGDGTKSGVRELQSVHVAGFEAITVEADDPTALGAWLAQHAFASTPQLTEWLTWYVEHDWKLTAFVFRAKDDDPTVGTKAIALTFETERPFYPYREPARTNGGDSLDTGRLLRVFYLSSERSAATLAGTPWRATLESSMSLPATLAPELAALAGSARRLTTFDDKGPRDGVDEVYFAPSVDQTVVKPPVQVLPRTKEIPIPLDLIPLALGIALVIWVRRRRKKRRRPEPNVV